MSSILYQAEGEIPRMADVLEVIAKGGWKVASFMIHQDIIARIRAISNGWRVPWHMWGHCFGEAEKPWMDRWKDRTEEPQEREHASMMIGRLRENVSLYDMLPETIIPVVFGEKGTLRNLMADKDKDIALVIVDAHEKDVTGFLTRVAAGLRYLDDTVRCWCSPLGDGNGPVLFLMSADPDAGVEWAMSDFIDEFYVDRPHMLRIGGEWSIKDDPCPLAIAGEHPCEGKLSEIDTWGAFPTDIVMMEEVKAGLCRMDLDRRIMDAYLTHLTETGHEDVRMVMEADPKRAWHVLAAAALEPAWGIFSPALSILMLSLVTRDAISEEVERFIAEDEGKEEDRDDGWDSEYDDLLPF